MAGTSVRPTVISFNPANGGYKDKQLIEPGQAVYAVLASLVPGLASLRFAANAQNIRVASGDFLSFATPENAGVYFSAPRSYGNIETPYILVFFHEPVTQAQALAGWDIYSRGRLIQAHGELQAVNGKTASIALANMGAAQQKVTLGISFPQRVAKLLSLLIESSVAGAVQVLPDSDGAAVAQDPNNLSGPFEPVPSPLSLFTGDGLTAAGTDYGAAGGVVLVGSMGYAASQPGLYIAHPSVQAAVPEGLSDLELEIGPGAAVVVVDSAVNTLLKVTASYLTAPLSFDSE